MGICSVVKVVRPCSLVSIEKELTDLLCMITIWHQGVLLYILTHILVDTHVPRIRGHTPHRSWNGVSLLARVCVLKFMPVTIVHTTCYGLHNGGCILRPVVCRSHGVSLIVVPHVFVGWLAGHWVRIRGYSCEKTRVYVLQRNASVVVGRYARTRRVSRLPHIMSFRVITRAFSVQII